MPNRRSSEYQFISGLVGQRENPLPFPDQPMKLFRPMADIEQLFKYEQAAGRA
jgi:hypothetical protein